MNLTFTQEDIIHFIYQGVPGPIRDEVKSKYYSDSEFHETCDEFLEIKKMLDKVKFTPSQIALDVIMAHSRKSA